MKKYLVPYHDLWEPDPEIQDAWQAWFARVGDRFVDSGTPLGDGAEITRAGTRELSRADAPATGYSIISALSREDAESLFADCPYGSSVRLYESKAM
jgi:hypothetical protein